MLHTFVREAHESPPPSRSHRDLLGVALLPNAKGNFCFDRVIALRRSRVCLICASKGICIWADVAIDRCAEGGTSKCCSRWLLAGISVGEAAIVRLSRQSECRAVGLHDTSKRPS